MCQALCGWAAVSTRQESGLMTGSGGPGRLWGALGCSSYPGTRVVCGLVWAAGSEGGEDVDRSKRDADFK